MVNCQRSIVNFVILSASEESGYTQKLAGPPRILSFGIAQDRQLRWRWAPVPNRMTQLRAPYLSIRRDAFWRLINDFPLFFNGVCGQVSAAIPLNKVTAICNLYEFAVIHQFNKRLVL